jgi:hypothetical protein
MNLNGDRRIRGNFGEEMFTLIIYIRQELNTDLGKFSFCAFGSFASLQIYFSMEQMLLPGPVRENVRAASGKLP